MKNSTDTGVDQHYNVQVAVDQGSLLVVASTLSNHPNDQGEAIPTLEAISAEVGKPKSVALDNGYFSAHNIRQTEARGIEPYIATGREPHHRDWQAYFAEQPEPPAADASLRVKMAYKPRRHPIRTPVDREEGPKGQLAGPNSLKMTRIHRPGDDLIVSPVVP